MHYTYPDFQPQEQKDVDICSIDVPVITVAGNAGFLAFAAEVGSIYVVDWKARSVHAYSYIGGGLGPSASVGSFVGSLEVGALGGLSSTNELTGWGWALSGSAALGPKGIAGQFSSNFSGDYASTTIGYGAGLGASAGGLVTYTRFDRSYSFSNLPKPIGGLVFGCGR